MLMSIEKTNESCKQSNNEKMHTKRNKIWNKKSTHTKIKSELQNKYGSSLHK